MDYNNKKYGRYNISILIYPVNPILCFNSINQSFKDAPYTYIPENTNEG